jgi:hypothetical protein
VVKCFDKEIFIKLNTCQHRVTLSSPNFFPAIPLAPMLSLTDVISPGKNSRKMREFAAAGSI